jgi:hypothetical protein
MRYAWRDAQICQFCLRPVPAGLPFSGVRASDLKDQVKTSDAHFWNATGMLMRRYVFVPWAHQQTTSESAGNTDQARKLASLPRPRMHREATGLRRRPS